MDAAKIDAYRPNLTRAEAQAAAEAISGGWAGSGIYVRLFEGQIARRIGMPHAVATNSGTAALHLALTVAGVEGCEVITSPLTSPATSHAILHSRATPVFCDVDPVTGCLDPEKAARLITRRTRAIVVVHFNGQPCDMASFTALARRRGLILIEDACGALITGGACGGKPLGSRGDFSCFSFSRKSFTTMDGGMVLCRRADWARRLRSLRNLGQVEGSARGDRSRALREAGYPYRMNDIAAAMGLAQLARWTQTESKLARLAGLYDRGLKGLKAVAIAEQMPERPRALSYYAVRTPRKSALRRFLHARGIATDDWLYPNHRFPLYAPQRRSLPIAERMAAELLYLPFYAGLRSAEVACVIRAIREF